MRTMIINLIVFIPILYSSNKQDMSYQIGLTGENHQEKNNWKLQYYILFGYVAELGPQLFWKSALSLQDFK